MEYWKGIKAMMVRFCYLMHGSIGVFLTVYLTQRSHYWFSSAALILLMMEIIVTFKYSNSGEWRWFTPLVLIYLGLVVPIVWLLEYNMLGFRIDIMKESTKCFVFLEEIPANRCTGALTDTFYVTKQEADIYNQKRQMSTIYQQTLMLMLILGRWLMPKGVLTRDELSQLLLVYIGIAADMLEFSSETFQLRDIACRKGIFTAILCVWSWSTLQFTLCLTFKKRRRRIQMIKLKLTNNSRLFTGLNVLVTYLSHAEIWALMTDVILQDAPYLVTRLYIIINYDVVDQSLIFFTCKNSVLIFIQFYRLYVVLIESKHQRHTYIESMRAKTNENDISTNANGHFTNGSVMMPSQGIDGLQYVSDDSKKGTKTRINDTDMTVYSISNNYIPSE